MRWIGGLTPALGGTREDVVDRHDRETRPRHDEADRNIGHGEGDEARLQCCGALLESRDRHAGVHKCAAQPVAALAIAHRSDHAIPGVDERTQARGEHLFPAAHLGTPCHDLTVGGAGGAQHREERQPLATAQVDLRGREEEPVEGAGDRIGLRLELAPAAHEIIEDGARLRDHDE